MVAGIFAAIFVPLYVKHKKENTKFLVLYANDTANNGTSDTDWFKDYEENITNVTYATLTPKGGYDNILIFLGGNSMLQMIFLKLFLKLITLSFQKGQKYIAFVDTLE